MRSLMNALLMGVIAVAGCSKDTGTDPDPAVCRNYLSNFTETTTFTQTGNVSMRTYVCGFNTSTNVLTCTSSRNGVGCETNTKTYGSTADFVDEVSVVPPRLMYHTETWTNISSCGANPNITTTWSFDAQRRPTGATTSQGAITTFTAWDAAGRPTASTGAGGAGSSFVYDASTRTRVITVTTATGAIQATVTNVYDTNGNLINSTTTSNGGTTTLFSGSTAQVCK
jgi:YD repeat-containing protein